MDFAVTPSEIPPFHTCEYLGLWFRGMGGAQLYAKYVKPRAARPVPLVLQFHGYPGASRSWLEQILLCGHGLCAAGHGLPRPGGTARTGAGFAEACRRRPYRGGGWMMGLWKRCTVVRLHRGISASSAGSMRELVGIDQKQGLCQRRVRGRIRPGLRRPSPGLVSRAAIPIPFLSDYRLV
ncbi:MAG: acetylxylan esterase [Flavonifractor plautii]